MLIQNKTKKHKPNAEAVAINITDDGINIGGDKAETTKKVNSTQAQTTTDSEFVTQGVNQFGMPKDFDWSKVKHIMVACDAGMGSSALGAGIIRQHINKENLNVDVKNTAAKDLTEEPDIIVTLPVFKEMAREKNQHAYIYVLTKFLGDDNYRALLNQLDEHIAKKPVKKGK
jgi:PTS system mannitol-specific IIC component